MEKNKMIVRNQGVLRVWSLVVTDILTLYGILSIVLFIYKKCGGLYSLTIIADLWPLPLAAVLCNLFARIYCGSFLYPGGGCGQVEELRRITISVFCGYTVLFAYLSLTRSSERFTRFGLLFSMFLSILLLPIFRYWTRTLLKRLHLGQIPVLIIGAGKTGQRVGVELERDRFFGFQIAGYLDNKVGSEVKLPGGRVIGKVEDCLELARKMNIEHQMYMLHLHKLGFYTQKRNRKMKNIVNRKNMRQRLHCIGIDRRQIVYILQKRIQLPQMLLLVLLGNFQTGKHSDHFEVFF